jgi:hypothetical protein
MSIATWCGLLTQADRASSSQLPWDKFSCAGKISRALRRVFSGLEEYLLVSANKAFSECDVAHFLIQAHKHSFYPNKTCNTLLYLSPYSKLQF